ncbi:MAG: hypothetical protein AAFX55_12860, partial [Bacteroidota bacterium]
LILCLILTAQLSECQDKIDYEHEKKYSEQESYILTTKGEKISIVPNKDITWTRFTIEYYKKADFYGKKKKVKGIGYITKSYGKSGFMKGDKIVKIVDGDRLYLPFTDDKKTKVFRYIAKNDNYILGTYILSYISESRNVHQTYYVKLDHDYNLIEKGPVFGYGPKKDREKYEKNIEKVKKEFGQCLGREDDLVDVFITNNVEPDESFSMENLEKNKKYRHYIKAEFLRNENQIQCD